MNTDLLATAKKQAFCLVGLFVTAISAAHCAPSNLSSPAVRPPSFSAEKSPAALCQKLYQTPSKKALAACKAALAQDGENPVHHQRLGQLAFRQKNLYLAQSYFNRALVLAKAQKAPLHMALALNGQARILRSQGKYGPAIEMFYKSLKFCQKDAKCLAGNHDALGYLHLKHQNYDKAEKHFSLCRNVAGAMASQRLLASCQYGLATVHYQSGLYDASLTLCKQSLQLYQLMDNRKGMAASLGCLTSNAQKLQAPLEQWCGYQARRADLYAQLGAFRRSARLRQNLQKANCPGF